MVYPNYRTIYAISIPSLRWDIRSNADARMDVSSLEGTRKGSPSMEQSIVHVRSHPPNPEVIAFLRIASQQVP